MWWLLLFIPLMLILHYFGIATCNTGFSVGGNWGTASWWRGKYLELSGTISRNFITRQYTTLYIEIETSSGEINLEIQDSSRNTLYAWGYISDLEVQIDMEENKKYFVLIRA